MKKELVKKKREKLAEKLTAILKKNLAGAKLYVTFSTSDSSKRWIEGCLADFEFILSSRGTRYWLRKPLEIESDSFEDMYSNEEMAEEADVYPTKDVDKEEPADWSEVEVDHEHILAKSRSTLMLRQFGTMYVYRTNSSGRY